MKRNLSRLLQVRALLEEVSRLDLEKRQGEMLSMEGAARQEECLALEARADAVRMLVENQPEQPWLLGIADAGILERKGRMLAALAAVARTRVEQARDELLARRMERRQVEALLRDAERLENQEQRRREQQRADEGYRQGRWRRQDGKVR